MNTRLRLALRREDGASAVEFALLVIPLLLLVFGIISFGLYFAGALGLSNASREAARYGVVQNRLCSDVVTTLMNSSANTLGIVYPITFSVTRPNSSPTVSCAGTINRNPVSKALSISYTASNAVPLWRGSKPNQDELVVTTQAGANFFIPTMTIDLSLNGKGTYRCEYS